MTSPCKQHVLCHVFGVCVLPGCSQKVGYTPCAIPKDDPLYMIAMMPSKGAVQKEVLQDIASKEN
jgi:hypothetical protein